jgi:hypothetical protein
VPEEWLSESGKSQLEFNSLDPLQKADKAFGFELKIILLQL